VIVPAMHGTYGEDGSLQGLLEWVGLPYVGSGVGPSAAAMDKAFSKALLKEAGVPVVEYVVLERDPVDAPDDHVRRALSAIDLPVYVKPLSLGSSIGVSRCADTEAMRAALSLAFELDVAAIVEPSVEDAVEVNCAVLGRAGRACEPSVCEQPIRSDEFLSFDDKYARGLKGEGMKGAQRLIPAPIGEELTRTVQDLAVRAFSALGCAGVARVDLLIATTGEVCVNEVNTIPGSFSFYLWEPTGLSFPDLLDRLLDLAFEAERERAKTTRVFPTNLLLRSPGGAKAQVPTG